MDLSLVTKSKIKLRELFSGGIPISKDFCDRNSGEGCIFDRDNFRERAY